MEPFSYTVVVSLDAHYIDHFESGFPTLWKFRQSLFDQPWVFFLDGKCAPQLAGRLQRLFAIGLEDFQPRYIHWPPASCETLYESQRHRMLAAYVHGAAILVETPYMMKLDGDAYATGYADNWEPWHYLRQEDVYLAPKWGYTKPPEQMAQLDAWADQHYGFKGTNPLRLPVETGAGKCRHARMCSWVSWYRMDHLIRLQTACTEWRLPVPSQDGFVWYCTERLGKPWSRYPAKSLGWANAKNINRHRAEVAKAMEVPCTAM